jgi:regulator of replication initiation timing
MFVSWMDKICLEPKNKIDKKEEIIEENNLPDIRTIKVADLKQHFIDGYEEIRQLKIENEDLRNKLEENKKFEHLYNSSLVVIEEFKKRDIENKEKIEELRNKINNKDTAIDNLNDIINTYKVHEIKINKKEEKLDKELFEIKQENIEKFKDKLINEITNTKGNISKSKLYSIIRNLKLGEDD